MSATWWLWRNPNVHQQPEPAKKLFYQTQGKYEHTFYPFFSTSRILLAGKFNSIITNDIHSIIYHVAIVETYPLAEFNTVQSKSKNVNIRSFSQLFSLKSSISEYSEKFLKFFLSIFIIQSKQLDLLLQKKIWLTLVVIVFNDSNVAWKSRHCLIWSKPEILALTFDWIYNKFFVCYHYACKRILSGIWTLFKRPVELSSDKVAKAYKNFEMYTKAHWKENLMRDHLNLFDESDRDKQC